MPRPCGSTDDLAHDLQQHGPGPPGRRPARRGPGLVSARPAARPELGPHPEQPGQPARGTRAARRGHRPLRAGPAARARVRRGVQRPGLGPARAGPVLGGAGHYRRALRAPARPGWRPTATWARCWKSWAISPRPSAVSARRCGSTRATAGALAQLATLLRGKLPEADLAAMQQLVADPDLSVPKRSGLHFGLAQVLDARGAYDQAAEHLRQANALAPGRLAEARAGGLRPGGP